MQIDEFIIQGAPQGAVFLEPDEGLCVAPGKMQACRNVRMVTEYAAGLLESIKRLFWGGPDYFHNQFQAKSGGGWVLIEERTPGQLIGVELKPGESIKIRRDRWMASSPEIELDTTYEGVSGWLMGTGVAMITASLKANAVSGRVFFSAGDGVLKKIDLHADKGGVVTVDNDSIVAYSADLLCAPKISGSGLSSVFFGKEGIVYDFAGKGTIYVGSMPQDLEQKNTCQPSVQPHNAPALEPESSVKRYR